MAYTKEQHIAALRKAVDAGDMESAEQIAATLDAMPQAPEAPEEEKSLYDGMLDVVDTVGGVVRAGSKGFSFGAAKPINAGIYAAGEKLMGDERPIGEIFDDELEQEQAKIDQFADENAALAIGAEITGGLLSPINKALGAIKIAKLGKGAAATTGTMAVQGGVGGMGYVFLDTNGSVTERWDEATGVAMPSAIAGVVGGKLVSMSKDGFNKFFRKGMSPTSTTQTLKDLKNAAYQNVKDNNVRFTGSMVNRAKNAFIAKVQASKNFSVNSKIHKDVMDSIEALTVTSRKKGVDLTELDTTQRALWKKYKAAKVNGEETVVLDAINMIDDLIQAHPSTGEAMTIARLANRKFMKAQTIDRIMDDVKVSESFKGTNNVDQMKQALQRILKNPRDSKHYDDIEIERFKEFIADDGTNSQRFLSVIGEMSPISAMRQVVTGSIWLGAAQGAGGVGLATAALGTAAAHGARKYSQARQGDRTAAFTSEMRGNARQAPRAVASGGMLSGQAGDFQAEENRDLSMLRKAAR
jgi:hypothetical protein